MTTTPDEGPEALPDAPPPDKETPQNYESEGGASPDGPNAIT